MLENGTIIPNHELSFDADLPKSYAFCSDTIYDESIIDTIRKVDLLYHESTFLESELHITARTMHCTAKQAATIAYKSDCKQLILGHYSTRYDNIEMFKTEAQTVFENVLLANDGKSFEF